MTQMLPNLQFSILCDDIAQDKRSGKFILHGLFASISGSQIPMVHPKCFVVNGWCNGEGTFRQQTRVLNPDKKVIIEDNYTSFSLAGTTAKHTIVAQFNNITFNKEGVYWIEVYLEDRLTLSYSFEIKLSAPA